MNWGARIIEAAKTALTPKSVIAIENETFLVASKLRDDKLKEIDFVIDRIMTGEMKYRAVANEFQNGITWWFIGITHFMEAGIYYPKHFNYHLHCGDPLTGRTFHVPKGRPIHNPKNGSLPPSPSNPYSWHESAMDAIKYMGYDKVNDWSAGNSMWLFEKYNGLGYRNRKLKSPYVWSYTTLYEKGKYTGDGKFDPNAVSKQPGTAAIYLRMVEKGLI